MVTNSHTLLSKEEYPKFNGKRIHSIYAEYENSGYRGSFYSADVLFYKCYYDEWTYESGTREKFLSVKVLPEPFRRIFGERHIGGRNVFLKNMYIRKSDSANGSFIDQTLDFGGWNAGGSTYTASMYRGVENHGPEEMQVGGWLREVIDNEIIGKSFEVDTVEFWECGSKMLEGTLDFATKYPYKHCPVRIVDGLVYPDEKLSTWRWLRGLPYREPSVRPWDTPPETPADLALRMFSYRPKHMRVLDDKLGLHVYLERFDAEEISDGEEGFVNVSFRPETHDVWGSEGQAYCWIHRFNETLEHAYVRYHKKKNTIYKTEHDGRIREVAVGVLYKINRLVKANIS